MKLQGVTIIRINEMREYFSFAEFWAKRMEFVSLFEKIDPYTFFEDEDQVFIARTLLPLWINGGVFNEFSFNSIVNDYLPNGCISIVGWKNIKLGEELLRQYEECQKNLHHLYGTRMNLQGLTLLYILLSADKSHHKVEVDLNNSIHIMCDLSSTDYVPCYSDVTLEETSMSDTPLQRKVLANMSDINIRITNGHSQCVNLAPHECVTGIFSTNKCCRLLPNRLSNQRIRMVLTGIEGGKQPQLHIEQRYEDNNICIHPNVCCFSIEEGEYPAWMTVDGEFHFDQAHCHTLYNKYEILKANFPSTDIIGYEKSKDQYVIYTSHGEIKL